MPFELQLPFQHRKAGWKVKIREKERLEPPHVTIIHRRRSWRLGLRDQRFLDPGDSWQGIPSDVKSAILENLVVLCDEWNFKYTDNPVSGNNDED